LPPVTTAARDIGMKRESGNREQQPRPAGGARGGRRVSAEDAEAIAIRALGFVAADPQLLPRFLAVTGIEAGAIRRAAAEPGFLAGVLNFVLAHEPTLIAFAENAGVPPEDVAAALTRLPLGDERYERST
jgi:hypothetical protein